MSLRILHIADAMPSPDSGAAGTLFQGVNALVRAGHQVDAVWADELSHRIGHYNLRYLLELPGSYRDVMNRHLRKGDYDVIQIPQPHGYLAAKDLLARGSRAVFVHRSHGLEPRVRDELALWLRQYPMNSSFPRRIARVLMERLLRRNYRGIAKYATGHLVGCSACARYLVEVLGVESNRVATIPEGVSQEFVRNSRCIDDERLRRILYVGQYAFVKAPMVLGAIASQLLARNPEVSFTWVCAKAHHQQALLHIAPEVRNRVCMSDWMPQSQLIDVYDRHGVFLFPSFFEGFGKAFLEAMSRGLVVIAADNGGAHDIITDGVEGFKVVTGDVSMAVAATERALNSPDIAFQMSSMAIRTASKYSWDRFAEECTMFYKRLIENRARLARA